MATQQQLENALRKADAAGNVEDAKRLAAAIRQMRSAPAADFSGVTSTAETTNTAPAPSFDEQNKRGLGLAGRMIGQGLAGLADFGVNLATRGPQGAAVLRANGVPVPQPYQAASDAMTRAGVPTYDTPGERVMGRVGEAVTGTAATMGLGAVAAPGSVLTAAPAIQTAAAAGSGLSGGIAREMGATPGQEMLASMAGGGAVAALTGRGASAGAPGMAQVIDDAAARGITIRPAAMSPTAAKLREIPLTGAKGRYDNDVLDWNRAAANAVGIDAPIVTPAVFAAKKAELSRTLNDVMGRNSLTVDQPLMQGLAAVENEAALAGREVQRTVRNVIDRFAEQSVRGQNGVTVPGKAYQSLDTQLGKLGKTNPAYPYVQQIRQQIRTAMDKSISQQDAETWAQWRQQYGDLKTLQPLVSAAQGKPLNPQSLSAQVNKTAYNSQARMAEGRRGEIGTVATIGKNIIPPQGASLTDYVVPAGVGAAGFVASPMTGGASLLGMNLLGRAADSNWWAKLLAKPASESTRPAATKAAAIGTAPDATKRKDKK